MYTVQNFRTKKELREALASGKEILVENPGLNWLVPGDGKVFLEGPHYPAPHTWYAEGEMRDGKVVKIK